MVINPHSFDSKERMSVSNKEMQEIMSVSNKEMQERISVSNKEMQERKNGRTGNKNPEASSSDGILPPWTGRSSAAMKCNRQLAGKEHTKKGKESSRV